MKSSINTSAQSQQLLCKQCLCWSQLQDSCFKVLVYCCHILHQALPVRPFRAHHLINIQSRLDANTFSCLEGKSKISTLVLTVQLLIWDVCWKIRVKHGTECKPIIPTTAEVCDVNVLITFCFLLTPFEKCVPLGATVFTRQC